jgi:hypothetical protein
MMPDLQEAQLAWSEQEAEREQENLRRYTPGHRRYAGQQEIDSRGSVLYH